MCIKTQFLLSLTFAIIVHKNLKFTLLQMMLKFNQKNNIIEQN